MTSRAAELAKMLGRTNVRQPTTFFQTSTSSYERTTSSWWSIIYPVAIILIFLFVILLIVHYTVKPIFRFKFGDRGFIPLFEGNDGQLVWTSGPQLSTKKAGFDKLMPDGFTLQQDIFIRPSNAVGKVSRVFSYRSTNPVSVSMSTTTEDLIAQYPETNLLMYLAPDTNDLTVSVITGQDPTYRIESAPTILNVPVGKPFRVTVILMSNLLEVYLNGRLFGTKTLTGRPRMNNMDFYGAPEGIRETVQTMNLQYWARPLEVSEVAQAPPPLPDPTVFGPISAECPAVTNAVSSMVESVTETVQETLAPLTAAVTGT